jgi:hypothetical protein
MRAVDEELARNMTAASIARLMTLRGTKMSPTIVLEHKKHAVTTPVPAGTITNKRDLAILVRDKTYDAVDRGDIDITDKAWKNVTPGLAAQKLLDQRESRVDDRKTTIALAMILSGASIGGPPAHLLGAGPEVIEGEAVELESA